MRKMFVIVLTATAVITMFFSVVKSAGAAPQPHSVPNTTKSSAGAPPPVLDKAAQLQKCAEQAGGTQQFDCVVAIPEQTFTRYMSPSSDVEFFGQQSQRRIGSQLGGRTGARTFARVSPDCAYGISNPNRFTSCSASPWLVTHTQTTNGQTIVLGTMNLTIESSVSFEEGQGSTPSWDLDTVIKTIKTSGTLSGGSNGTSYTGCLNNHAVCTTSQLQGSNAESEQVSLTPNTAVTKWYTQYAASMNNNAVLGLKGHLGSGLVLNTPANPVVISDFTLNTLHGRCDQHQNRYKGGCVDDAGPSYVLYSTIDNPKVGPVAQHVYDAIRTLPSHWGATTGTPLNRLTDETAADRNRAISCGNAAPPAGQSCDEYPLASTYQGGNGAAPHDRSTRLVPRSANNSQGGLTSAYYDYYRILDQDRFYVQAILADGSRAW